MVNYREEHLNQVFAALSDPTRRAVLARLARARSLSVTALAEPFDIKLPAVMKHLDVLAGVGLIRRAKPGAPSTSNRRRAPQTRGPVAAALRAVLVVEPRSPRGLRRSRRGSGAKDRGGRAMTAVCLVRRMPRGPPSSSRRS